MGATTVCRMVEVPNEDFDRIMASAKQRIFSNTVGGYLRSLLAMFVGIFTGRWVLEALGAVDLGLFAVVGSLMAFVTFINSVLSYSVGRHLAFAVGQGRAQVEECDENVQRWFNVALLIHTVIPVALILVGYPIGMYAVRNWLTVPSDRIETCVWVFRLSLVTTFFSMMTVPYSAIYGAKQRIVERSLYDVGSSIVRCALAFGLLFCPGDRLLIYALYMTAVSVAITVVYRIRCWYIFPESHIRFSYMLDRQRIGKVLGYASWNVFGVFGWMIKEQGLAVLANKYFGPTVNAAMGVAQQVSGQVNALSSAVMAALSPEIVSTEGEGNRKRMLRLAMSASRFASLLSLLFMMPLFFEMDYVIHLWLKNPPEWSVLFCKIFLIGAFLNSLSVGQAIAIAANGKIARSESTISFVLLMSLPIAWVGCRLGYPPWIILTVSSAILGVRSIVHVIWARVLVGMSVLEWLFRFVCPLAVLILVESAVLGLFTNCIGASFWRVCITSLVATLSLAGLSVAFVLAKEERDFIVSRVRGKLNLRSC